MTVDRRITFGVRLFQMAEDLGAQSNRVRKRFHRHGQLGQTRDGYKS